MATLIQISENVARELGRPELVTDFNGGDYTPTATFLRIIKSAHALLDDRGERRDETVVFSASLATGANTIDLTFDMHTILHVDIETTTERIGPLTERTYEYMRSAYTEPFSDVTPDQPIEWSRIPRSSTAASADVNQLLLMPPADTSYTVYVIGQKYTALPSSNTDESWWSYYKPFTLVKAIKRQVAFELNRNMTEVQEYDAELALDLFELERQKAMEEQQTGNRMGDTQ